MINKNIYNNQMNLTAKALKEHYLSSILPFQSYKKPKQIQKNSEFYKPDKFIWNNPYRTSKKIYSYYHKQNEEFNNTVKPHIQYLEQKDRQDSQSSRIHYLNKMRKQTRQKLHNRRQKRQQLQYKSRALSAQKIGNTSDRQTGGVNNRDKTIGIDLGVDLGEDSGYLTRISYIKKVDAYDTNIERIKQMMGSQIANKHQQIRTTFQCRKNRNDLANSQIKKQTLGKLSNK